MVNDHYPSLSLLNGHFIGNIPYFQTNPPHGNQSSYQRALHRTSQLKARRAFATSFTINSFGIPCCKQPRGSKVTMCPSGSHSHSHRHIHQIICIYIYTVYIRRCCPAAMDDLGNIFIVQKLPHTIAGKQEVPGTISQLLQLSKVPEKPRSH